MVAPEHFKDNQIDDLFKLITDIRNDVQDMKAKHIELSTPPMIRPIRPSTLKHNQDHIDLARPVEPEIKQNIPEEDVGIYE